MSDNLYILKCNGFYKIGIANSIQDRLNHLQTGNPYQLEVDVYYSSPVSDSIEKCLHNKFNDKRVRGEWFSLDDDDLAFIDSICGALGAVRHDELIVYQDVVSVDDGNSGDDEAEQKTYQCRICDESFTGQAKLAAHTRWQHANGNGHSVTESAMDAEKVA